MIEDMVIREVYKDDVYEQYEIRLPGYVMFLHRARLGVPDAEGKCLVTRDMLFVNGIQWQRGSTYKEQLAATDEETVEQLVQEWLRQQAPRQRIWEKV